MKARSLRPTSSDKVNGRFVKYTKGDCLSIDCQNGSYLSVLVSEKFNKYYDFALLEFYKSTKPVISDFINGKFFGTRFGSWDDLTFAVDKRMIECKYVDDNKYIENVGRLELSKFEMASYSYINNVEELLDYYLEEIPIRIEKTRNAERFPDIAFVSKHLVDMKNIL